MESITGKLFEAILFVLEVSFELIEFFLSFVLLFLSSFVLCSLCFIVNVYDAIMILENYLSFYMYLAWCVFVNHIISSKNKMRSFVSFCKLFLMRQKLNLILMIFPKLLIYNINEIYYVISTSSLSIHTKIERNKSLFVIFRQY